MILAVMRVCEFAGTQENVTKHVEVTKAKSKKQKAKAKAKNGRQKLDALKAGDKSWSTLKAGRSKSWRRKLDALKAGA